MAEISLSALSAKLKNQDQTLGESLGLGDMALDAGVQLTPLRYVNGEYRWDNTIHLYNDTDDTLRLVSLSVQHRLGGVNGELVNEVVFLEDRLPEIHLGDPEYDTLTLSPGEEHVWSDGHPLVDFFDAMVYIFTFRDQSGQDVVRTFRFSLSHELPEIRYPDYSSDHGRDLATLRYDADFEVKVSDGVYWVPARALGDSRYTNAEVQAMLTLSPEEKQAEIGTLYEALQFYQIGAFAASNDNIRIYENGVDWEHHKPGYHAVRTNHGCCATDSNWLRYLLDNDYDEVGFIATSQRDGSGHIYNYILEDGWYYIIDLTHYRTDWVATAIEDGTMESYYDSDRVLGNIHKVQDISKFVDYVQEAFNDPPGLMFMYTAENCLAIDGKRSADGSCVIIYEAVGEEIQTVIFDDPTDRLTLRYDPAPKNLPNWAEEASFDFTKIAK